MANATFPLAATSPHFSMQVEIESLIYTLRYYFEADGYWYLSIYDEASATPYREGRRVLPIGDWLELDAEDRLLVAQFRDLYDHASGLWPGMLYFVSPRPLELKQSDAAEMEARYLDRATLLAAQAGA